MRIFSLSILLVAATLQTGCHKGDPVTRGSSMIPPSREADVPVTVQQRSDNARPAHHR